MTFQKLDIQTTTMQKLDIAIDNKQDENGKQTQIRFMALVSRRNMLEAC